MPARLHKVAAKPPPATTAGRMMTRSPRSHSPLQPAPRPTHLSPRPMGWESRVLRSPFVRWPHSLLPAVPGTCPSSARNLCPVGSLVPPAAAASAVTEPRAWHPGSCCHSAPTSRRTRQMAARAQPPPRPRRPAAEPAGIRSPSCSPLSRPEFSIPFYWPSSKNLELLFHYFPFQVFFRLSINDVLDHYVTSCGLSDYQEGAYSRLLFQKSRKDVGSQLMCYCDRDPSSKPVSSP